jgi:hypothetical protein
MTRQESFKRRIRSRMSKTGERYAAARRVLIEQAENAQRQRRRAWVSAPEMTDDAITAGTGRGWEEWCDLIEDWPGHADGHAAVAQWLDSEHEIGGWWAQTVTVGYERIAGIRMPHQMADGTFTANKSRTITADVELLDRMLRHADDHADLFPGEVTELRSRSGAKAVRIGIGGGTAVISVEPKGDDRARITIQHTALPAFDDVERWKFYWKEWLDALDES